MGSRVDVGVFGGNLVVRPRGWDVVWTLRRRIVIPLSQVRGITVASLDDVPRAGLRLPGTAIPGVIRAGSYGAGAQRDFWDVRKGPQVVWIELVEGAEYRRLILQTAEPHALALSLRPTLGAWVPQEWRG